ncbi:MAG: hypothetical protein KGL12_12995 [Rhodospirillales bacterium]|nr:hypothetical protein [Rhodospirillales bacterium]
MIRRIGAALALALPLAIAMPGLARAQSLDLSQGGPITITASGGLEWRQVQQEVIASGDAQAVRGNVTVQADRLIAFYRKKASGDDAARPGNAGAARQGAAAQTVSAQAGNTQAANGQAGTPPTGDTGGNEIYRLEAIGHVRIFTPTDTATGDRAVYDMDQAVLILTGHDLRLTTPSDVLTARDSMEYWPQKHMAVARGNAVVVTKDARRISADVLVAYTDPGTAAPGANGAAAPPAAKSSAKPAPAPAGTPPADPLAASGKLREVQAFGQVVIRTPTDTVSGDRGIYVPATGLARLIGHVHITRGQNQLNGSEAQVDLKSGVSRLIAGQDARVRGLVLPNEAPAGANLAPPAQKAAPAPSAAPATKPGAHS